MLYAPVLIPTLNRYQHFRNCLESLSKCKGAGETEVYVGLDYPPAEKYREGYEKIKSYLDNCGNLSFREIHVIKREKNYGFGLHGNANELINMVFQKYDRYIMTEDDNVFSPNFLSFVNQGLELYENNQDILFVCGYNYPIDSRGFKGNHYFSHEFSAWGYGTWKKKRESIKGVATRDYLESIVRSANTMMKIYKQEPRLINTLIYIYQSHQIYGDTMYVSYQYLNNKLSVFPVVSMTRNLGFDGSGSTITKTNDVITNQKIDESSSIELKKRNVSLDAGMMKKVQRYFIRPWWMNIAILVRIFIHAWTGKDIFYYYDIKRHQGVKKLK